MKVSKSNKGSTIIEMTLLIPIILGVFYLYISLFLFLLQSGKYMKVMAEKLYYPNHEISQEQADSMTIREHGERKSIYMKDTFGMFDMNLELHRNGDNVVENIRRWQLATDTIHKRGNE